jgi:hypothetical protein
MGDPKDPIYDTRDTERAWRDWKNQGSEPVAAPDSIEAVEQHDDEFVVVCTGDQEVALLIWDVDDTHQAGPEQAHGGGSGWFRFPGGPTSPMFGA